MEHIAKTVSSDRNELPSGLQMPEILQRMNSEQRAQLNQSVRKKIDMRLLPMVMLMYIMNYIDR